MPETASSARSLVQHGNYIDGQWVTQGSPLDVRNPANIDEVVALFTKSPAAEIDRAAAAAQAALPAWAGMPAPARGNILFKAADILDSRFEQIAADMTREEAKTLP